MMILATAAVIGTCLAKEPALQLAKQSGALVVTFKQGLVIEWPHRALTFKNSRNGRICVVASTELKDGVSVDGDY